MFSKLFKCLRRVRSFSCPEKGDTNMPVGQSTTPFRESQLKAAAEVRTGALRRIFKLRHRTKDEESVHCERRCLKKYLRKRKIYVGGMTLQEMRRAKQLLLESDKDANFGLHNCYCKADSDNATRDKDSRQVTFDGTVRTIPESDSEDGERSCVTARNVELESNDQGIQLAEILRSKCSTASTMTLSSSDDPAQSQSVGELLNEMDEGESILRTSVTCDSRKIKIQKKPMTVNSERSETRVKVLSNDEPEPLLKEKVDGSEKFLSKQMNESKANSTTTIRITYDSLKITTEEKCRNDDKTGLQSLEEPTTMEEEESSKSLEVTVFFDETIPVDMVTEPVKENTGGECCEGKLIIDKTGKMTPEEIERNNKLHVEVLKWFETQEDILAFLTGSTLATSYISFEQPEP